MLYAVCVFFFSSRRRHTRFDCDWSSDVALPIYGRRGIRAAFAAPDVFGRLLALGVTTMVLWQALINFAVVLGMVPTKGIPLPFVSYGGSSLLVMLLGTGVLLNISQQAQGVEA